MKTNLNKYGLSFISDVDLFAHMLEKVADWLKHWKKKEAKHDGKQI